MTINELKAMTEREFVQNQWGNEILDVIDATEKIPMTCKEFLTHCTACGGDWGGMLLTGIKELYPRVWDAIPDKMGKFAMACICDTLVLLGVEMDTVD